MTALTELPTIDPDSADTVALLSAPSSGFGMNDRKGMRAAQAIAHLGIPLPAGIIAAGDRYQLADQRARQASDSLAPQGFTSDDLLADDWIDRLRDHQLHERIHESAAQVARQAMLTVAGEFERACREEIPALGDLLEGWFVENYDTLAQEEDQVPTDTFAAAAFRERLAPMFRTAHHALMTAGGGQHHWTLQAQWRSAHSWTTEQWRELVDRTLPNQATRRLDGQLVLFDGDRLKLARELGAKPKLARSYDELKPEPVAV